MMRALMTAAAAGFDNECRHSTSFTRFPFKLALQGEFIYRGIAGFQQSRLSVHADRNKLLVPVFALTLFNLTVIVIYWKFTK
jgi:hypothetical protein